MPALDPLDAARGQAIAEQEERERRRRQAETERIEAMVREIADTKEPKE
jgi:hypothetical protein